MKRKAIVVAFLLIAMTAATATVFAGIFATPPLDAPPVDTPSVQTPAVNAPPVDVPPVEVPLVTTSLIRI